MGIGVTMQEERKLKIAVILTGHARSYKECFPSVKAHLLDRYDVDVYVSTWNYSQSGRNDPLEPIDVNDVIETYNPKKYHIENWIEYFQNKVPIPYVNEGACRNWMGCATAPECQNKCRSLEGIRDQYYIVKKGFELIENPNEYDLILRFRFDMDFFKFEIDELIDEHSIMMHRVWWEEEWNSFICSDQFAYGKPQVMEKYCKLYDYFPNIFSDRTFPNCIELVMWHHLSLLSNLNVKSSSDSILYNFTRKQNTRKFEILNWIINEAGILHTDDNHFGTDPNATPSLGLHLQQRPYEIAGLIDFLLGKKDQGEELSYYAEIGACSGGTSFSIQNFLQFKELLIIDDNGQCMPGFYVQHRHNLDRNHILRWIPRVEIIGSSAEPRVIERAKTLSTSQKYDFLLIDGDHSYDGVRNDTLNYFDIVRDGGYIAFHDTVELLDIVRWLEEIPQHLPLKKVATFAYPSPYTPAFPNGIGITVFQKQT